MLDPIDKSKCSVSIPAFASAEDEAKWIEGLTPEQRMELLNLSLLARHGEEAMMRGMDRSHLQVLTMAEFHAFKVREDDDEERWRLQNGWPARFPALRAQIIKREQGGSTLRRQI